MKLMKNVNVDEINKIAQEKIRHKLIKTRSKKEKQTKELHNKRYLIMPIFDNFEILQCVKEYLILSSPMTPTY